MKKDINLCASFFTGITENFCNQSATRVQLIVVKKHGLQVLVASNSWLQFFSTDSCYSSNWKLQSEIATLGCNFFNFRLQVLQPIAEEWLRELILNFVSFCIVQNKTKVNFRMTFEARSKKSMRNSNNLWKNSNWTGVIASTFYKNANVDIFKLIDTEWTLKWKPQVW